MKNLSTLIILVLAVGYSYGQSTASILGKSISIAKCEVEDSRYAGRSFVQALSKVMDDEYEIARSSPLTLSGDAHVLDTKTIEGMETFTYVEVEVNLTLTNMIFDEKSNISFIVKGKGSGKDKAIIAAVNQLSKNKEVRSEVLKFMNDQVDAFSEERCSELVAKVRTHVAANNYDMAYLTLDYINPESSCGNQHAALTEEILDGYKKSVCELKLQKAKIMVNSKDEKVMTKAIDLLLQIPPGAPCEAEVLQVAKQIGEYNQDLSENRIEILNKYVLLLEDQNQSRWLEDYRKQLYSGRKR